MEEVVAQLMQQLRNKDILILEYYFSNNVSNFIKRKIKIFTECGIDQNEVPIAAEPNPLPDRKAWMISF